MIPSESPQTLPADTAIILLGRGGLGPAAREEMQSMVEGVRTALPGAQVEGAFVDRESPSLPEALDACAGARRIVVQPVFIPGDKSLLRWLQKVALRWRARQSSDRPLPEIAFAPALGSLPELSTLLARQTCAAGRLPDVADTAGEDWQRDPIAWSNIPPHQRHVLFCLGPRCAALGAATLWQHLGDRLRASGKLQKTVMMLQTSCQYPCNHGPLMIVHPDGTWYGKLDEAAIDRIVEQHLDQGTVDEAYCVYRRGG
ncbi:CbiX/SirB N-terminal domain-containing protein [Thauera butanivorans]|uniref:CbiX/SirB N-terminal domain-containing protein n=1 Tax=Thauera butanivorans TaxID=86174 RepID=UPI003AB470EF